MSGVMTRLNLRPEERRLIVAVGAVLFIILNIWLVWPHYRDWGRVQTELDKARATLANYEKEAASIPKYQDRLKYLESQGSAVLPSEQALQLTRAIQNQAIKSGVMILQTTPLQTPRSGAANTNQFFEEQTIRISVNTGEKELVNFLYAVGSDSSMIRVRDLDLRPDPGSGRTRLVGGITLVASYQKKVEVKTGKKTESKTNSVIKAELKKIESQATTLRRVAPRKPEPNKAQTGPPTTKKP
jgi:Tfp pilus assembly protein PilO